MSRRVGNRHTRWWTEERAIAYLQAIGGRRAAKGLHPTPTMSDMAPNHMTFVRLFGSVKKAQIAAGFRPNGIGRPKGRTR
jgi:hypothetical protein